MIKKSFLLILISAFLSGCYFVSSTDREVCSEVPCVNNPSITKDKGTSWQPKLDM